MVMKTHKVHIYLNQILDPGYTPMFKPQSDNSIEIFDNASKIQTPKTNKLSMVRESKEHE